MFPQEKPSSSSSLSNGGLSDTLRAMRHRLQTHVIPEVSPRHLELRQRLSDGAFGTVFVADARGLPAYGGTREEEVEGSEAEEGGGGGGRGEARLVAVKFLAETAGEEER